MTNIFKDSEFVVYPPHGVGRLVGTETHSFEGQEVKFFVITFEKERMTLRLPEKKAIAAGLRPLSSKDAMTQALDSLKQKTKIRRTMWSRRAQEYENSINSGDPISIAKVIRDLYRSASQPDQSYSERQIYQLAVERFVRELAAVEKIDENDATKKLENALKAA